MWKCRSLVSEDCKGRGHDRKKNRRGKDKDRGLRREPTRKTNDWEDRGLGKMVTGRAQDYVDREMVG